MRIRHLLLPALALAGTPLAAQVPQPAAAAASEAKAPPPKLIVAIAVDQFSADLFAQYRANFQHGLKRLANGAVFPSAYQSHAATETCPGHSTILTGSRPARTGIIANNWFDLGTARDDKNIYCAEDERVAGSTSNRYTVSPYHLRVLALGDHMKRADPRSRVAVAAGKDRAAVMMGGHGPDQRWYWSGRSFSSISQTAAPAAAGATATMAVTEALAQPRPAMELPEVCAARGRATAVEGTDRQVGAGRFARAAGETSAFRASPEFDAATVSLALGLRDELRLGQGEATDLLIVGLSATDYVGHSYGTQGAEMCLQMLALDRAIGDLFAALDAAGIDYLAMLTADHGGSDIPERSSQTAVSDAVRVDAALDHQTVGKAVGAALGLAAGAVRRVRLGRHVHRPRALSAQDRERVLTEAVRRYREHPHVAAVFTKAEMAAAPAPSGPPEEWTLEQRVRASFDPERSGDFLVLLKPRVSGIYDTDHDYVSGHGSPWSHDRRVPLLFWRPGLRPFEQPYGVETVDILPTLAASVGLSIDPQTIDGRCLDLLEGSETNCPAK